MLTPFAQLHKKGDAATNATYCVLSEWGNHNYKFHGSDTTSPMLNADPRHLQTNPCTDKARKRSNLHLPCRLLITRVKLAHGTHLAL